MPRNQPKPLNRQDEIRQGWNHDRLVRMRNANEPVTVRYVKRNGTVSESTGKIGDFSGRPGMDTGSVTIHTAEKGARTVNLHRIFDIEDF